MRALPLALTFAALLAGCASSSIPNRELSKTEAAIRAADEVGAPEVPRAALHLKMARDQLALAHRYIAADQEEYARTAIERALTTPRSPSRSPRKKETREEALEAQKKVQKLRAEALEQ